MIYICGDSFAVPDPEYGPCWVDILAEKYSITNLARVCASNLMIAQQVDQALEEDAQYIIVLFSASTRQETLRQGRVIPYSIHSLDATTPFSELELDTLRRYAVDFFDLDLAIYRNRCIIEATLHRLVSSGRRFSWDQGGFEHPSYGGVGQYFVEYSATRSEINLWDYAQTRTHRPYYHIQDSATHKFIAEYYSKVINEQT